MNTNGNDSCIPLNKNKEWTQEDHEKCKKMILEKKSDIEIAKELGRTDRAIPFRRCRIMYEMIQEGHSKQEIKELMGITMDAEYESLCEKGKKLIEEENTRKEKKFHKEPKQQLQIIKKDKQ